MPVFHIHHITKYEYDRAVKESVNEIRIYPFTGKEQEVLFHDLTITGRPEVLVFNDYWGNRIGMFNLAASHKELVIESKLTVRTINAVNVSASTGGSFEDLSKEIENTLSWLELRKGNNPDLLEEIHKIVEELKAPGKNVAAVVESCSTYIFENFKYIKGITNIETTVEDILLLRSGVCQDFAHLMLEILRSVGIPSRYVSGYICPNKDGLRGEGATHAWVEAWLPGYGWAGIDPTNNVWVSNHHVKLAVGRNFNDCSPVKGTFKGPAKQSLSVYVSVGYEDGHRFEELNHVMMLKQAEDTSTPDLLETFAGQQQQ